MNDRDQGQRNKTIRRSRSPSPLLRIAESPNTTPSAFELFLDSNASEAYRRPWHKLERGLRRNRIRQFVEDETSRKSLTTDEADQLSSLLLKLLERKVLNSKSVVNYNIEEEKIMDIKGLQYIQQTNGSRKAELVEKKGGGGTKRKKVGGISTPDSL